MGRLKELVLENFKSYDGKQTVGPFANFTCIIGPNGAGKSNMMDAISFVLGVQSRHLRSTNLAELIFRKDSNSPQRNKATVSLVYQPDDNEVDGYEENAEIVFSRSVDKKGASTYKIDEQVVTFKRYEEVLETIGVLVKARNFLVFQGDVESVASKSPQDMTKLFEQISGSDQLKEEYDTLLNQKTEIEETANAAFQKKKMYGAQLKEVKKQKEEAEEYQEKKAHLNSLKTDLVMWQLWRIIKVMDERTENCQRLREERAAIDEQIQEVDAEIEAEKQRAAKVSKSFVAAEKDHKAKKKAFEAIGPQIDGVKVKVKNLNKRLTEIVKCQGTLEEDKAAQAQTVREVMAEIAAIEAEENGLRASLEQLDSRSVQLDASKLEEYSRLRQEVAAQTSTVKSQLDPLILELTSKQTQLQRIIDQGDSTTKESASEQRLVSEYTERANQLRQSIQASEAEIATLERSRDGAVEQMRSDTHKLRKQEEELAGISSKLSEVGDERHRSKQEEKMQEAIESLKSIYPGVHGKLVNLCKPIQKKYSVAISVAAGRQMDAIVVDTRQTATDCIKYLRDHRIGSCVFLPLDNIASPPIPERLRNLGSKYLLCVDVIEYEHIFKPAIIYAVGTTLVCDELADAQDLAFNKNERNKIVTLKGHVISKSGAMTGGHVPKEGASDRWEEKEHETWKARKTELLASIAELRQATSNRQVIADFDMRIKVLQTRMQYNQADLKVAEERLGQINQQLQQKQRLLADREKEKKGLSKSVADLESRIQNLQTQLREVESRVFRAFSASVGVSNIREFEENNLKQHQDLSKKRKKLSDRRAALNAQLDYEKKRDFEGPLQRYSQQHIEVKNEITAQEQEIKALESKERAAEKALQASVKELEAITKSKSEFHHEVAKIQQRKKDITEKRDSISKKISGEEIAIERSRVELHEVLEKALIEEISLPVEEEEEEESSQRSASSSSTRSRDALRWTGSRTKRGKRNASSEEDSESASASESSSSRDRSSRTSKGESAHYSQSDNEVVVRDRAQAARVDLSSMRTPANNRLTVSQINEKEKELSKQIADLTEELEEKQPNMHAIEKYETVRAKCDEAGEEANSLKDQVNDVTTKFEDVKKKRTRLFKDCFDHVSENLNIVYKDLTRSSKHTVGGQAYITSDNSVEPYLGGIHFTAMPPMKRYRDMVQLSGGEKTIAALALLFSVHSYRQAPFFVLDEVDAALDNVNVKKICNYIQQRSIDFQCIVISLKEDFYQHADCLFGICKDIASASSRILSLDLRQYSDTRDSSTVAGDASVNEFEPSTPISSRISESVSNMSLGKRKQAGGSLVDQFDEESASPSTTTTNGKSQHHHHQQQQPLRGSPVKAGRGKQA